MALPAAPPLPNSQTPEPLNSGQALLDALTSVLARFVVLPKHAAEALALWIVHTYAFELRDVSVYIGIESPEKRCGKTTLLTVLSELAHNAIAATNISPSAFFHVIEKDRPTLLIDEADTFLNANEPLRGILNAGYKKKTAYVLRTAPTPKQDSDNDHELSACAAASPLPEAAGEASVNNKSWQGKGKGQLLNSKTPKLLNLAHQSKNPLIHQSNSTVRYSTWCPKAIATIDRLPDTLADRCIIIRMQRKLEGEQCDRLRNLDADPLPSSSGLPSGAAASGQAVSPLPVAAGGASVKNKSWKGKGEGHPSSHESINPTIQQSRVAALRHLCAQFVREHSAEIAHATPALPSDLSDRAVEIWEPLVVIADLAGGEWPQRARQAAVHLAAGAQQTNPTGCLLLDIFVSFFLAKADRLLTRDLLESLDAMGDRPWKEMRQGNAITDRWLAQQLRPYGIKARTFRVGDIVSRGYVREDFRETFKRYIPKAELQALKEDAV